jgi:hypothetical protein
VQPLAGHWWSRAALTVALATRHASAADALPCPVSSHSWVLLVTEPGEDPALAHKLLDHLRAELEPRRIEVCSSGAGAAAAPLGTIRVSRPTLSTVAIRVSVEDAVTDKEVSRNVDLRALPPDAHPLTIALGAAELLRASWAEIDLKDAPPPPRQVPPEVRQTVAEAVKPPPRHGALGVSLAGEEFGGRLKHAGADARLLFEIVDRWALTARLGVRYAQSVKAADGRIQENAWIVGLGAIAALTPPSSRVRVGVVGRTDLVGIRFWAAPRGGATGASASGVTLAAGGGLAGSVSLGRSLVLDADIVGGGVLHGVNARDGGKNVVGASGAWIGAATGVSVLF